MVFIVDIGNSDIHAGIFENDALVCTFSLATDNDKTADEYAFLLTSLAGLKGQKIDAPDAVLIGSVVPSVTRVIKDAVFKITGSHALIVGPGIKTGFPIKIDDPSELGADLVANAAGALKVVGAPLVAVDFGTATTVSAVDKDGAYLGGAIMPGIKMSLDALSAAALLPDISPENEVTLIGKNTKDSMLAGVIRGEAMAVVGFIEACKKTYFGGEKVNIALTGGLCESAKKYLPKEAVHIPDLTLLGLYEIYKLNSKKKVIPRDNK